ncbi:Lethal giant larvae homologue 2 domain-containing protein [Caenorhabditis elegans]|uniref:Lethal giant larvae homologue 2 domain-containing protein n=1 Tax=Caenorhabditis elegans TaxID=6239 RepID=G5EE26_CAEEL|nr:Lethal giant larvae homologue 2 domain-containing protein [Caenorhabditis elegans]AAY44303.1 TOM-1 isoform E [Caenorhabditis elegans]CCD72085.1 Lethal giant larvae homologue 2 domain-containing protein [Caenorhabditis elegans]|eukprot:NP_001122495.1 TOMosyn synaptic protein [Caenorhabditis elegans]
MDRAKKKFASAIDGLRSLHNRTEINVDEKIQSEHCRFTRVVRHGLPEDPRCFAYDPVQRLIAIGTGRGHIRIIGDAGVDYLLKHESGEPVLHMQFLVNEGGLITSCGTDSIHLWNYRQKTAEIVHTVQLSKESVSCIHLPVAGKWLFIGTDKGNVYFLCLNSFLLSPYVINWNKAIDLSCRVHPGPVRQLAVSPAENTKLLIVYDKGIVVQWNLGTREVDRYPLDPPIKSVNWHFDGRQILTGNVDGSISLYNHKKSTEAIQRTTPHGSGPCRPIQQVEWKHMSETESIIMFSGGMPTDDGLPMPALTILKGGKSATVLEMDWPIIQFIPLNQNIWNSIPQCPHSVAVLLKHDFMVLDLNQNGHPVIESPHAMNIHESPVTCMAYYSDCPLDLIGALTLVGTKQRNKEFSARSWPVTGGLGRECATGHQELVVTGHKDGSLKFWQETGEHLQILYKLKSSSHFERLEEMETSDKVSHAVKYIELCLESRQLLVAGISGQVTLFRFTKQEICGTIAVVNIPLLGNLSSNLPNNDFDKSPVPNGPGKEIRRQRKIVSRESTNSLDTSDSGDERIVPFKVRGAPVKRPPGFVPELACFVPWHSHAKVDQITTICLNSSYGIIAIGTSSGLALVDTTQCALIYSWTTNELYGSDPTPAIQLSMQLSDAASPLESPISLEAPKRIISEQKQRSFDARRPQLFKTQSVVENGSLSRGDSQRESPSSGRQLNTSSPSTSSQSLERSMSTQPQESITSLSFIHSYSKKNDSKMSPCLWVGTSAGASLALNLILPEDRFTSTIVVAPSVRGRKHCYYGTVVRLKGQVISQSFMDNTFCIISPASESYKEAAKEQSATSPDRSLLNRVNTKASLAPQYSSSIDSNDEISQILIVAAENEVKVVALPTFSQLYVQKFDEIPLVKATPTHIRGYPCLMCLSAAGQIIMLSLPSLRILQTSTIFPHSVEIDDPLCQKTAFSDHGLGVYMASQTEMEKYTMCSEIAEQTGESLGELFVPCEMPEQPKNNSFLKGVSSIFGGTPRNDPNDIDAILSENMGVKNSSGVNPMRSVARTIPGPSVQMDRAQAGGVSAGQAAAMALQNLNERTEKLNATVDATENLKNNAMSLSSRTGKLVEKYEKKKWYNF